MTSCSLESTRKRLQVSHRPRKHARLRPAGSRKPSDDNSSRVHFCDIVEPQGRSAGQAQAAEGEGNFPGPRAKGSSDQKPGDQDLPRRWSISSPQAQMSSKWARGDIKGVHYPIASAPRQELVAFSRSRDICIECAIHRESLSYRGMTTRAWAHPAGTLCRGSPNSAQWSPQSPALGGIWTRQAGPRTTHGHGGVYIRTP